MDEETSKALAIRIQPKMVFGLRPCPGNIQFTLKDEVIYTAAAVLVIHDYKTNKQKFLRFPDKVEISYVITSGNRKYLGLAETTNQERTVINTYELATLKKRNSVQFPADIPTKKVAAMSFTNDAYGLAILTKEPDAYILLVYFDKNQVMGRVSHSTHQLAIARCIACSPIDTGMVAIGGDLTFKLVNKTEKGFAPIGSIKGDGVTITSMAWLTNDVLVAGTDEGDLFIVESGDLKLIYVAHQVTLIDLSNIQCGGGDDGEDSKKEMQTMLQERRKSSTSKVKGESPVQCLTHFKNGFCFALNNCVHVFRKEAATFKKTTVITIPILYYDPPLYRIQELAINKTEETCIVTCRHSQIYIGELFVPESVIVNDDLEFRPLGEPLHIDRIIGMSTCAWKPIVVTASNDQTIRIWNFATGHVELVKKFLVDIVVISVHPSGLFVAVGFCDQLRLMDIMLDDLKVIKSYNFPKCQEAVFSNKGHLLAASYGTKISIVSVFTFDVLQTLVGHNGLILSLSWCEDDLSLVSAGVDGAIYQWDIFTGKRTNEVVQKGIEYRGVATLQNNIFAITNAGALREIVGTEIIRETKIPNLPPLTAISLARSGLIMFISSEHGHLFNVQLPFMESGGGTCTNFRFFNLPITKMCLTYDDNYLITASADGTLAIWTILNHEHRKAYLDEKLGSCSDVLISRKSLLDKIETVSNLEARICQQSEEFEYLFKQKEISHQKQVDGIHKSYSNAIEELKSRNNDLERQHVEELNMITAKNAEAEDKNQKLLMDMETEFHRKIIIEYEKNKELSASFNTLRDESNAKLRKTAGYLEDTIESMESDFKQQIDNRRDRIQQLVQFNESLKKEFVEYCRQEKNQHERQMVRLRLELEKKMLHEQEVNSKWRNEAGVVSKKYNQMTKENNKLKDDFLEIHEAHSQLQSIIEDNSKKQGEMHREMDKCMKQVTDKDRVIEGLVKRVGELEADKKVIQELCNGLQSQLKPKDDELRNKIEEMRVLESELECLHKTTADLERILSGTKQRHEGLANDVKQKTIAHHEMKTYLARVIADIHMLNELILKPDKLKKEVVKLYAKYQHQETGEFAMESTLFQEFQRQLDNQVQRTKAMGTSTKKPQKPIDNSAFDLLKDNVHLVSESQELRKKLTKAEERVRNLEKLFRDYHPKTAPKDVKILLDASMKRT